MLKPWLVSTLLWFWKGGMLVMLATVAWLSLRADAPATEPRRRVVVVALVCLYAAVSAAGWTVGFRLLILAAGVLFLFLYAFFLMCLRGIVLLACLASIPLLLFCWLVVGSSLNRYNTRVPLGEKRLTNTLVCRAYPHNFDSIVGTRVVLARKGRDWFRDDIIDEILTGDQNAHFSCSFASDGSVIMRTPNAIDDINDLGKRVVLSSRDR